MKILISDISWDGADGALPTEVTVDAEEIEGLENAEPEALKNGYADEIAEYLSDEYGYCVFGFAVDAET